MKVVSKTSILGYDGETHSITVVGNGSLATFKTILDCSGGKRLSQVFEPMTLEAFLSLKVDGGKVLK